MPDATQVRLMDFFPTNRLPPVSPGSPAGSALAASGSFTSQVRKPGLAGLRAACLRQVSRVDPVLTHNFCGSYDRSAVAPGQVVPSLIKSVTIDGQIHGTADPYDHFGFVAEEIVSFKVGTYHLRFLTGPDNDTVPRRIGASDVAIHEV